MLDPPEKNWKRDSETISLGKTLDLSESKIIVTVTGKNDKEKPAEKASDGLKFCMLDEDGKESAEYAVGWFGVEGGTLQVTCKVKDGVDKDWSNNTETPHNCDLTKITQIKFTNYSYKNDNDYNVDGDSGTEVTISKFSVEVLPPVNINNNKIPSDLELQNTIAKEKKDGKETGNYHVNVSIINPWDYTWLTNGDLEKIDGKEVAALKVKVTLKDENGSAITTSDKLQLNMSEVTFWQNYKSDAKAVSDGACEFEVKFSDVEWADNWGNGDLYDSLVIYNSEEDFGASLPKDPTGVSSHIQLNFYVASADAKNSGWKEEDIGRVKIETELWYKLKGDGEYSKFELVTRPAEK